MKKQVELSITHNGKDVVTYPYTKKEHVQFENGMNIDEFVGQDIATPTITHDTTAIKVGVGDSDVSSSVVDSAVNMTIKGQTYQNILPEPTLRNEMQGKSMQRLNEGYDSIETVDGVSKSAILKGQTLVNVDSYYSVDDFSDGQITSLSNDGWVEMVANGNYRNAFTRFNGMIKPNTKYLAVVEVKENTLVNETLPERPFYLFANYSNPDGGVVVPFVDQTKWISQGQKGLFKYILTSRGDLSITTINLRNFVANTTTSGRIIYRTMLIEYVEGMENWDIPFFRGIQSVKMPILKTVGKNLFPPLTEYDDITKNVTGSEYELTENKMIWNSEKIYTPSIGYYFNLKPNTKYTFSCSKEGKPEVIIFDRHSIDWDSNHSICTMSTIETTIDGRKVCNFITRSDGKVCIRLSNATGYTVGCWIENCCLTEASISNAHVYEDYKTNILETSNDVVLRGLPNGVKDSYDCLTGEYVQRVSGITLDGTQSVSMEGTLAYIHIADLVENNVSMSDALPSVRVNDVLEGVEGVAVQNRGNDSRIYININGLTTAEEITQRLQQKPVTIQYQLAEPIVTTIEPSTTPFAYENGHIILESGHEGQSLLPTLEYQTVVSRSGQVAMIDKTIQQHERKITLLEKMLVQNIIDIEYKNTLLALKLEIDEVI